MHVLTTAASQKLLEEGQSSPVVTFDKVFGIHEVEGITHEGGLAVDIGAGAKRAGKLRQPDGLAILGIILLQEPGHIPTQKPLSGLILPTAMVTCQPSLMHSTPGMGRQDEWRSTMVAYLTSVMDRSHSHVSWSFAMVIYQPSTMYSCTSQGQGWSDSANWLELNSTLASFIYLFSYFIFSGLYFFRNREKC